MQLRRALSSAQSGEILIPRVEAALASREWETFTVTIKGPKKDRKPDGWFHPSTHPLWDEAALYYYLTAPDKLILEPFDSTSWQAVSAGTFWHAFISPILVKSGVLIEQDVPVSDPEVGSRGEMDGVLKGPNGNEGWEFKTMNSRKMDKIPKGGPSTPEVLQWFMETCPVYVAQADEYLRISGLPAMRFLIGSTEYPFKKREILLPYNEHRANQTRDKYRRVRQAVDDGRPPLGCGKKSMDCPARAICGCP